ncbi:MAG: hypothetical protein WA919_20885 [Coleofasciculaceae cyanobacterium]
MSDLLEGYGKRVQYSVLMETERFPFLCEDKKYEQYLALREKRF